MITERFKSPSQGTDAGMTTAVKGPREMNATAKLEKEGHAIAAEFRSLLVPFVHWQSLSTGDATHIKTLPFQTDSSSFFAPAYCLPISTSNSAPHRSLSPSFPSDVPLSFSGPSGRLFLSGSKSQCRDAYYPIRKQVSGRASRSPRGISHE